MGCDIIMVVEYDHEGEWVGVSSTFGIPTGHYSDANHADLHSRAYPSVGRRDYAFFSRLAGVRGQGPSPLGMPHDASALARITCDAGYHSHSYLPLEKFALRWMDDTYRMKITKNRLLGDATYMFAVVLELASVGAFCKFGQCDLTNLHKFRVVFCFSD
jgi:hypothetical protein